LWKNDDIHRRLSPDDVLLILEDLIQKGHGEWVDNDYTNKTTCRIFWRQPKELAADIYEWAKASGNIGSVCTMYELHSGEDVHGMSFQGVDEELLRRALGILEDQGKCAIFQGDTSSEDGIKFF
jgi:ESCRT-II complex subunit VPS25